MEEGVWQSRAKEFSLDLMQEQWPFAVALFDLLDQSQRITTMRWHLSRAYRDEFSINQKRRFSTALRRLEKFLSLYSDLQKEREQLGSIVTQVKKEYLSRKRRSQAAT